MDGVCFVVMVMALLTYELMLAAVIISSKAPLGLLVHVGFKVKNESSFLTLENISLTKQSQLKKLHLISIPKLFLSLRLTKKPVSGP